MMLLGIVVCLQDGEKDDDDDDETNTNNMKLKNVGSKWAKQVKNKKIILFGNNLR